MSDQRPVIIAGNWKMNHSLKATADFFTEFQKQWSEADESKKQRVLSGQVELVVCAPYLSLVLAKECCKELPVEVGAQNAHWENAGAFTGEVSGSMLKDVDINTVLVGHSERRQYFGETDETVNQRAKSLLKQDLRVILCVGETLEEREGNKTEEVLMRQLSVGLSEDLAPFLNGKLVLAYEPVWAIGTGLTASPEQAEEAHKVIRKFLFDRFGMEAAGRTPILYGGSVKPENISTLLEGPNVDGGLVGGASLKAESFFGLIPG